MNPKNPAFLVFSLSLLFVAAGCCKDEHGNYTVSGECFSGSPTETQSPDPVMPPASIASCPRFNGEPVPFLVGVHTLEAFTQGNPFSELEYLMAFSSAMEDAGRCLPQLALDQLNLNGVHLGVLGPTTQECLSADPASGAIQRVGVQSPEGFYRAVSALLCAESELWSERCVGVFEGEEIC